LVSSIAYWCDLLGTKILRMEEGGGQREEEARVIIVEGKVFDIV
jgi:hypothetical protein